MKPRFKTHAGLVILSPTNNLARTTKNRAFTVALFVTTPMRIQHVTHPDLSSIRQVHNAASRGQNHESGFTLIEVLVTLVILSVGLLSLAALQIATLKNNNSALTRFEATTHLYEILDRMRANRTPALQGAYNIDMTDTATAGGDIASQDLRAWKQALLTNLPDGNGSIAVNNRIATVTVQWTEDWDKDLNGQPMTLAFRTEL
jgi:type IV pilus assembly protein PilV